MPARAVDVAYIGACTGAKLDDLRAAAAGAARPAGGRGRAPDGRARQPAGPGAGARGGRAAGAAGCGRELLAHRLRRLRRLWRRDARRHHRHLHARRATSRAAWARRRRRCTWARPTRWPLRRCAARSPIRARSCGIAHERVRGPCTASGAWAPTSTPTRSRRPCDEARHRGDRPALPGSRAPGVRREVRAGRRDRGRPELRHRLLARAGRRRAGAPGRGRGDRAVLQRPVLPQRLQRRPAAAHLRAAPNGIAEGERIAFDARAGHASSRAGGQVLATEPIPGFLLDMVEAGRPAGPAATTLSNRGPRHERSAL